MVPLSLLLVAVTSLLPVKITVLDRDSPRPAAGMEVFLERPEGARVRLGATNDQGQLTVELACLQGSRLVAEDNNLEEYVNERIECPIGATALQIRMRRKGRNQTLLLNAEVLYDKGERFKAALAYNELRDVMAPVDAATAAAYDKKIYESLASELKVARGWKVDPLQEKVVMTPELLAAVKALQKKLGLTPDGKLDYETLSKAAGIEINQLLFRTIK